MNCSIDVLFFIPRVLSQCLIHVDVHHFFYRRKKYFKAKWLKCIYRIDLLQKPTKRKSILEDPTACLSVDSEVICSALLCSI